MHSTQDKIKEILKAKSLKDGDLIKASGIPSSTYYEFMASRSKSLSASNLWLIAKALGVSADYLLDPDAGSLDEASQRLTPRQKAGVAIFEAMDRLGWEEVARLLGAEAIREPGSDGRVITAPIAPIDPPEEKSLRETDPERYIAERHRFVKIVKKGKPKG